MDGNGMLSGQVLLARPHAFIAPLMRPWLSEQGYEPVAVQDLGELQASLAAANGDTVGAIVSTSLTSTVKAPVAEVLGAVRDVLPGVPVAIATLADPVTIARALESSLGAAGLRCAVRCIRDLERGARGLGGTELLPLIHRDDIRDAGRVGHSAGIIRRHFHRAAVPKG